MLLRIFLFVLCILSIFLLPNLPAAVHWDQIVVQYLAAHRTPFLDELFWVMTALGGGWVFAVAYLFPILFYLFRRQWINAVYYLVGVGLLKLSVSWLKAWVARPRPSVGLEIIPNFAMPSGHAANAVLLFGVLGIFCYRKLKGTFLKTFCFVLCLIFIFVVDLSRVYLGVHFPSDVILGTLYIACGLWVLQGLKKDIYVF